MCFRFIVDIVKTSRKEWFNFESCRSTLNVCFMSTLRIVSLVDAFIFVCVCLAWWAWSCLVGREGVNFGSDKAAFSMGLRARNITVAYMIKKQSWKKGCARLTGVLALGLNGVVGLGGGDGRVCMPGRVGPRAGACGPLASSAWVAVGVFFDRRHSSDGKGGMRVSIPS